MVHVHVFGIGLDVFMVSDIWGVFERKGLKQTTNMKIDALNFQHADFYYYHNYETDQL